MRILLMLALGSIVGGCFPHAGYKSGCVDLSYDECIERMDRESKERQAREKEREEKARIEYARQRQLAKEYAARQQAERAVAEQRYQERVASYLAQVKAKGYELTAFRDFQVDGAKLAERRAKIAVEGRYLSLSEGGYLVESLASIAIMRRTGQLNQGIPLLTDNASRSLRSYIIECASNAIGSQLGCPAGVYGMATTCTLMILGTRRTMPCIDVKGGWHVQRPQ